MLDWLRELIDEGKAIERAERERKRAEKEAANPRPKLAPRPRTGGSGVDDFPFCSIAATPQAATCANR